MQDLAPAHRLFALVHKLVFISDRRARAVFSKDSSNFTDFLILNIAERCAGASQQTISDLLNLTPAAVSRRIDALARLRLLKRASDPSSRRTNLISISVQGSRELVRMREQLGGEFKKPLESLTKRELEQTCSTLEKLLTALTSA